MEAKKILIKENGRKASLLTLNVELWTAKLNKSGLIPEYCKFKIGTFTTESLKDCLTGNCKEFERKIKGQAEKDVTRFSNVAIQREMLKHADIQVANFRTFCNKLYENRFEDLMSVIDYLEVKDDQIMIKETANDQIKTSLRYEISDEKEIEIYNEVKAISDHYNNLLRLVGEKTKFTIHVEKLNYLLEFDIFGTYESKPDDDLNYWQLLNI